MKRFLTIVLCLSSVLLLCAWGTKKVEFLDNDKLIDLEKAIEFAKPGADSVTDTEGENNGKTDSGNESGNAPEAPVKDSIIVISIRDEIVTYNGSVYKEEILENTEVFENMLIRDNKDKTEFKLVDDFAEAHVYKCVLEILKKLHAEANLKFTYE